MDSDIFLFEDDAAQQLVLQALHGHSEVDGGGLGADLRGVRRIRQLSGYIEPEAFCHTDLFVSHFHLKQTMPGM